MKNNLISRILLILVGSLMLHAPLSGQTVYHNSNSWVQYFSSQPRVFLEALADSGWITKQGNKFYTILLDSSKYSGVEWRNLPIDTPLLNNARWWAFKGDIAQEPHLFYCRELEIKFNSQGIKSIKITPLPAMSNYTNDDLGTFFNNGKLHKSKADREKKLKEKKAK